MGEFQFGNLYIVGLCRLSEEARIWQMEYNVR